MPAGQGSGSREGRNLDKMETGIGFGVSEHPRGILDGHKASWGGGGKEKRGRSKNAILKPFAEDEDPIKRHRGNSKKNLRSEIDENNAGFDENMVQTGERTYLDEGIVFFFKG